MLLTLVLSPLILVILAVVAVAVVRLAHLPKPSIAWLVTRSLVFAVTGVAVSLGATYAWMIWYERSSGYSAGNAPVFWFILAAPPSAALGQLLALLWWCLARSPSAQVQTTAKV